MTITLPAWVRRALYILTVIGTPVTIYAKSKGWIGDLELALWGSEVTVVSALAAFKTSDTGAAVDAAHPVQGDAPPAGGF